MSAKSCKYAVAMHLSNVEFLKTKAIFKKNEYPDSVRDKEIKKFIRVSKKIQKPDNEEKKKIFFSYYY